MANYIEIVETASVVETDAEVTLKLSATPPPGWIGFFGQAWILAVLEGTLPADFGSGASIEGDRLRIPGESRAAVEQKIEGLRRVVAETNRIFAGYHGLMRMRDETSRLNLKGS